MLPPGKKVAAEKQPEFLINFQNLALAHRNYLASLLSGADIAERDSETDRQTGSQQTDRQTSGC